MTENKKALEKESNQNTYSFIIPEKPNCQNVMDNMPVILKDVITLFQKKHINISLNCMLNILLAKTAQMLTAKRITMKEVDNILIPNWYSIVFMPSGAGKDRLTNDFDRLIFNDFRLWFKGRAAEYKKEQEQKIQQLAADKFPGDKQEKQRQAYINAENEKIRNVVIEMQDGTQEGFYSDAKSFSLCDFGSLFLKISEFGLYLKTTNTEKEMFLNCLYNAYDGKVSSKCIKGCNREPDVENLPVNVLLYSDYTLFKTDVKSFFNSLMETGLNRRACVTFMSIADRQAPIFSFQQKREFSENASMLKDRVTAIFSRVQQNACYCLSETANNAILNKYVAYLNNLHNKTDEPMLKTEILSRELKALKLSALYACLNHPTDLIINETDLIQAITTVQGLSQDLNTFLNYRPQRNDKYDILYSTLKSNIDKEYTKTSLVKELMRLGWSRRSANKDFEEIVSYIKELALDDEYIFMEQQINNNSGMKYFLRNKNEQLENNNIISLEKILVANAENMGNALL